MKIDNIAFVLILSALFLGSIIGYNLQLMLILLLFVLLQIFFIGIKIFQKFEEKKKIDKKDIIEFAGGQILMLVGFTLILYFSNILSSANTKLILDSTRFFQMGSFSLVVVTFIFKFLEDKNNIYVKKICLLTLTATLIFFTIGGSVETL